MFPVLAAKLTLHASVHVLLSVMVSLLIQVYCFICLTCAPFPERTRIFSA